MSFSFFTLDGSGDTAEVLTPTSAARSLWSRDQMHGVAVSGALARAIERRVDAEGRDDLRPARYTLDMFRPATMDRLTIETEVIREGRRILLVDARLLQGGETRARASSVWLLPTEDPAGQVWAPDEAPSPPPLDLAPVTDQPHVPWFRSDAGWSQDFGEHQNAGHKTTWQHGVPIVPDEPASPFVSVASIADATTMVCNWGSQGVEHINTDITLSLARLPRTGEVGLSALHRSHDAGIAVGTAVVFDRDGVIGTSMLTALANNRRTVDFDRHEVTEEGTRRTGA